MPISNNKLNFSALLVSFIFAGCNGGAANIADRQIGESCNNEHGCVSGLYCDSGVCRSLCINDRDCKSTQDCKSGRCITRADGSCREGWIGDNCGSCAENYFGPHCDPCPDCGQGHCNDDIHGDGTCRCDVGWSGDNCTIAPLCKNGTADESGHCVDGSCTGNWTGADCDTCAEPFFGENCDHSVTCKHGVANTDPLSGDGHCLSCLGNWDAGSDNDCTVCKTGWRGESCDFCASGFYGAACYDCSKGAEYYGREECTFTDDRSRFVVKYNVVRINDQLWLAENLAYAETDHLSVNNDAKNDSEFGYLYKYDAARTACPDGWRLPSAAEFSSLLAYADAGTDSTVLRAFSFDSGTDSYGFAALAGGGIVSGNSNGFSTAGNYWSSSLNATDNQQAAALHIDSYKAETADFPIENSFSVRCVKQYCQNGILDPSGSGQCLEGSCNSHFAGPYCDQCWNGWTGENCDKCIKGYWGQNCVDCSKENGSYPAEECRYTDTRDQNNNSYQLVRIGDTIWMAENLAYTGSGSCYKRDDDYYRQYGCLYLWAAAKDICPAGWYLPTNDDINNLLLYAREKYPETSEFMALIDSSSWPEYSVSEGGYSGLDIRSAGLYYYAPAIDQSGYYSVGERAEIWVVNSNNSPVENLILFGGSIFRQNDSQGQYGFSVRCLKR